MTGVDWSPDGRRIAFADLMGLFVVDATAATGNASRMVRRRQQSRVVTNGSQIAFDGSRGLFHGDIYVVNANSDGMAHLTDSLPLDSNPSWSPDGRRIAFMRKQTRKARARVFVMNADGSAPTDLGAIGDAYSRPSWSSDGTRLAYSWLTACIVPKVAGRALQESRSQIRRASCSVGRVRFRASPRPRGTVLFQQPRARAERRIGSKVNLVASRGR